MDSGQNGHRIWTGQTFGQNGHRQFRLDSIRQQQLTGDLIEVPEYVVDEGLPWVFVMIHIKPTKNPERIVENQKEIPFTYISI